MLFPVENTISVVVSELVETLEGNEEYEYEIILVNDGSPDSTYEVLKQLADVNKKIKVVNFSQNYGQHAAVLAGYSYSKGNIIVGMDDDGENSPRDIFKLVNKLNEGFDYVCAKYSVHQHSVGRRIGTKINEAMSRILIDKPKGIGLTSYYAVKRYVIDEICQYKNPYPYIPGLLLRTTKNIGCVEIEQKERLSGTSGYNLRKMLSLWLNGFTAFSVKPLRVATLIGFLSSVFGFLFGLFIIISKFLNSDVLIGYSSIMASIWFIGGIILLVLGLIGEYIGRIYISINKLPQYVVKERINLEDKR